MITTKQFLRVLTPVVLAALVYLLVPYFLIKAPINQALANGATLEWGDCWFSTRWWRPVYCGWFTTAESTDNSYQLPVVYIPYVGWDRESDPILYLNGGPGSSAYIDKDNIGYWWQWIDDVSARRDWLIYEQRGTGISPTALTCVDLHPLYRQSLTERSYQADYLLSVQQQLVDCFDDVIAAGYQIDFLNTHYNAKDALDLMQALVLDMPISQWNLYGISYGSRLALEIMRLQPQYLRSVVLDGVYPPQVNGFLTWPKIAEDTFSRLDAWCMENVTCRNENAFFMQRLEKLLPRLRNEP
ncbi:MAG TPA: alpha/beta fold hydrolase, partial [Cellvibrionaceae bacterium]